MLEVLGFDPVALALGAGPPLWLGMLLAVLGMAWAIAEFGVARPRDTGMILSTTMAIAGFGLLLHGAFGYSADARMLREALETPDADVWIDEDNVKILIPARKDTATALGRMVEERTREATLVFPKSRLAAIDEALRAEGGLSPVQHLNERR